MNHQQYKQILNDWEEKVLKLKPQEVVIKYENDEFIIETKIKDICITDRKILSHTRKQKAFQKGLPFQYY